MKIFSKTDNNNEYKILDDLESNTNSGKNKKKGHADSKQKPHQKEFKIRASLRKKLFVFVAVLILALLLTIYFITTRDTRSALISELKKKGGVISEEKAKAAWTKVFELVTSRPGMTVEQLSVDDMSILFIELIRKDLHPRDVIYSYIINRDTNVVIHSEDPEREPSEQYSRKPFPFPQGVYPYLFMFNVKNEIDEYLSQQRINLFEINDKKMIEIANNVLYEKLKGKLVIQNKPIDKAKFLDLTINAFNILKEEREELLKFLSNIKSDLTGLRNRFRENNEVKMKITELREMLEKIINEKMFSNRFLREYARSSINNIKTLPVTIRGQLSSVLSSIINFFAGYIVQSYRVQTDAGTEQFLDISFPIAQKVEDTGITRFAGEIHVGISLRGVNYTIRDSERKMQWIAFLDILFGLVMTLLLATYFTHPIKKIVAAMRKVGEGDLEQDVKIRNKDEIGLLANNFNEMVEGLREKEKIRAAMNKAVSKEIAEKMLEGEIKLGGERVVVTMLFSDIRGFTSMSEKMQPEEVITMLNEYMTEMSKIIDEHRGVIDKFVGDEIMAIYGAPVPVTDEEGHHIDALLAVKSAVKMIKMLQQLNEIRVSRGQHEINIGIGLNTGEVVAGNMGSENRLNYTVLGDNVNLAARLCDKAERMMVLVSESTYEKVMDHVIAKKQPPLKVKGKEKPLNVYHIIDVKD